MNNTVLADESFYYNLRPFNEGRGVTELANYTDVPDSWHVVLADIKNSTEAIRSGKYKEVNMVGAAAIAAVCNVWDRRRLPYVFGGDGATFLVPSSRLASVLDVLSSAATMATTEFGLELRVGSAAVKDLRQSGSALKIAKQALSPHINQAIFSGGGLALAEDIIKRQNLAPAPSPSAPANYEGLECRWQPIASQDGEIVSVLIRAQNFDIQESFRVYLEIIEEIELLTGGVQSANPARKNKLSVALGAGKLATEVKVRQANATSWMRAKYLFNLFVAVIFGKIAFALKLTTGGVNWGKYKKDVIENSDFWKFDDMLRFVIDVSPVQKRALLSCLESHHRRGEIYYGVHASHAALMTCLVFDRQGEHVHFMDGDDGGYALAASQLKAQIKQEILT